MKDENVFDQALAAINEDGKFIVLEFAGGKQISMCTRQTMEEVERDIEEWSGQVEYLEAELSLLYSHIRRGTPLSYDDSTGRVSAKSVVDYLIERSKDEIESV